MIKHKNIMNTVNSYHERLVPDEIKWYNNRMLIEHIKRYEFAKQFVKNKVVLDIACGSGYGTKILCEFGAKKVYGIDLSKDAILYAKNEYKHPKAEYKVGDVLEIPLKNNCVDIVVSFETIEHIENVEGFINEAKRVLKKGGKFIVSTPNKELGTETMNPFHIKEFYFDEFKQLITYNFEEMEFYGQGLVPGTYLRLVEKIMSFFPTGKLRWFLDSVAKYPFRSTGIYEMKRRKIFSPGYFIAVAIV